MNEIEGFRGIKWGEPPSKEMVLLKRTDYNAAVYELPNDNLNLDGAKLSHIGYMFFGNKDNEGLMKVELEFNGRNNYELLRDRYREKFGPANGGSEGSLCSHWLWWRQEVCIALWYLPKKGASRFSIAESSIEEKCVKARQERRRTRAVE